MSLPHDIGLFKFDFTDRHAILGVPIDADFKEIRQRYLKIARLLHPDSTFSKNASEKQQANELLSKLVNPAYEKFTSERGRSEYILLLKDIAKRTGQEQNKIQLNYPISQELNKTNNIDHIYKTSLQKLAQNQYKDIQNISETIAQISELNLVYLMRKTDKAFPTAQSVATAQPQVQVEKKAIPQQTPEQESLIDQYLRRAQKLMEKNNFPQARIELQDALKLEPNNVVCHSLMGIVYLKQNQLTMARVHINKALQLDPNEPMALRSKQVLEEAAPPATGKTTGASDRNKQEDKPKSGGLFGGLFGGKKK